MTKLPNLFLPGYLSVASCGIVIFYSFFFICVCVGGVHCLCCIETAKVRHQRVKGVGRGGRGGDSRAKLFPAAIRPRFAARILHISDVSGAL